MMSVRTAALAPVATSQQLLAVLMAASMGLALLFLSGFAEPSLVHNAAHDWRHAHNFPCH
jgi:cobalt transporter subunit CbtB